MISAADGWFEFDCDEPGCVRAFATIADGPRSAKTRARRHGYAISGARTYCPEHKGQRR